MGVPVLQNPKVTADRAFNGFGTNFENSPEPVYGNLFLPRKFKVGLTVPGECCSHATGAVNSWQLAALIMSMMQLSERLMCLCTAASLLLPAIPVCGTPCQQMRVGPSCAVSWLSTIDLCCLQGTTAWTC